MKRSKFIFRLTVALLLFVGIMGYYVLQLLSLQVAQGQTYLEQAEAEAITTRTVVQEAVRGELFDRYGRPLITNAATTVLRFNASDWDRTIQNSVIRRVTAALERTGNAYVSHLPIGGQPLSFTGTSGDADRKALAAFLTEHEWDTDLSAEQILARLCTRYKISDTYTVAEALRVAGVRYDMENAEFSVYAPFVIASDADTDTIAAVLALGCPGVETAKVYTRVYNTTYAAHILGRVGPIPAEEADAYLDAGYALNDRVGLSGLEKALEETLRGTDGVITQGISEDGQIVSEVVQKELVQGCDYYLTIDLALQEAAENALASRIEQIRTTTSATDAAGGAAVVIDIDTADVLASASYPTFNLATFSADYATLSRDPLNPYLNRAVSGTYPPGSVFKMVTATAALQEGIITPATTIRDEGLYDYYAPDYVYRCWIYRDRGMTHGLLDVVGALQNSCNYFFYEVGRLMGIETLDKYARLFGLGEKTGVELLGESDGTLAGPEARENGEWYAGDTLQASIGQSDSLFTPMQLASYIATLAGGGTRYETHLVNTVMSGDSRTILEEVEPTVVAEIDFTQENLDAVLEGMLRVTEDGTASKVFADYPISVIGKTGSAQVDTGTAHGVFVLAAPAEDPEIAIAVVVEHGGSGNNVATIARDILTAYLSLQDSAEGTVESGVLLP